MLDRRTKNVNYVVTEMGNLSAKEVVKLHMEKLRSADFVYYSTSGGLSKKGFKIKKCY